MEYLKEVTVRKMLNIWRDIHWQYKTIIVMSYEIYSTNRLKMHYNNNAKMGDRFLKVKHSTMPLQGSKIINN